MRLKKNICEDCCKGKRISELDEKVDIQGTEYIPFQKGDDNGKFSLGSLKDYLFKLIEEYLINNGIIREDWVQSEPAYKLLATLPELIADRACKDEFGNNINDTYLTREAVKEYIGTIYEDLFVNNPPQILDGFITVDMLSDAVLQLLNSGGAITNFPDDEDITVKDGKLKFKDKVYDPNNYSGIGRTILRKNMVGGVNVLTQEMISEPNQIYIIQYDYDLRGETIVVPDNSILWYLGGSLNNGHITSDDGDKLIIWGNLNGDIEIDIDVSVVGAPSDEEDITTESGVLKFKDKEYDTASFSGLGRKYLRKNIVSSINKNILTQDMIKKTNTQYIIQYDYDLGGETITVPEGCVLQFEGGSLSNGTLYGNNTLIHADSGRYIFDSISFIGNFKNGCFYADWFGCADIEDCSDNLQWAVDAAQSVSVKSVILSNKTYKISKTIKIPSFFSFGGLTNNSLSVWKRVGTTSLIYQTANLPIIELGNSEGARNISLHDIALRPSTDYQGTKDNLYGIYTSNINFSNNSINNVWVYGCKFGMYIRISNGGGFTETSCINLSLTENIIGLVVEKQDTSTANYPWMNQNYFRLCYFNANRCGGVWINNVRSFQNNLFQTCNFEGMGKDYKEEEYNTYGCFAFKCNSSIGSCVFDSCYIEGIFPSKDGVIRTGIDSYSKESGFILGTINAVFRNNTISAIRQFITLTDAAALIKLQSNDYYLTKRDEYTSDALIRILRVSDSSRTSIDIDENRLSPSTVIKRPYILDTSDSSSDRSLYSSSVNIKCPSFTEEKFSNANYGENFTLYIDSSIGNANYSGLTPYNPFANLDQILYYNVARYTKAKNITIELLSDTTLTRNLDTEIFQGLNIKIKGNKHKILLSDKQIPLVDCNITFEDVTIEINNTAPHYSTFRIFGKATICFKNCVISFKGGQNAYFIRSYSGADCYVNFSNSEMNKEGGRVYITYKGSESNIRVRKINFTADDISEISDMILEEDFLNYDYITDLNFTRLSDKKHYVYSDDEGNFHNSDGTLTSKVAII